MAIPTCRWIGDFPLLTNTGWGGRIKRNRLSLQQMWEHDYVILTWLQKRKIP